MPDTIIIGAGQRVVNFSLDDLHKADKAISTYALMGGTQTTKPRNHNKKRLYNVSPCGGCYDINGDLATIDQMKAAAKRMGVSYPTMRKRITYQELSIKEAFSKVNPNQRA